MGEQLYRKEDALGGGFTFFPVDNEKETQPEECNELWMTHDKSYRLGHISGKPEVYDYEPTVVDKSRTKTRLIERKPYNLIKNALTEITINGWIRLPSAMELLEAMNMVAKEGEEE